MSRISPPVQASPHWACVSIFCGFSGTDCEASCHSLSVGACLTAHHLGAHHLTTIQATASSTSTCNRSVCLTVSYSFCVILFLPKENNRIFYFFYGFGNVNPTPPPSPYPAKIRTIFWITLWKLQLCSKRLPSRCNCVANLGAGHDLFFHFHAFYNTIMPNNTLVPPPPPE